MFNVTKVEDVNLIIKLWPRLQLLAREDRQGTSNESLLTLLLACFSHGAIFTVHGDAGLIGFVCVDVLNDHHVALRSIPREKIPGIAKACLTAVKEWAKGEGYKRLFVTSTSFSGSSFKYFKHTLGLPQYSITFSTKL